MGQTDKQFFLISDPFITTYEEFVMHITDRQTDGQTDRQTDSQTDKQTNNFFKDPFLYRVTGVKRILI